MGQDLINLNLNIPFIIPRSVFSINVKTPSVNEMETDVIIGEHI